MQDCYCVLWNTTNTAYHMRRYHKEVELTLSRMNSLDPTNLGDATNFWRGCWENSFSTGYCKNRSNCQMPPLGLVCKVYNHWALLMSLNFDIYGWVLNQGFKLSHRTHFTDKIIPSKYETIRGILDKLLCSNHRFLDIWSPTVFICCLDCSFCWWRI